MARFLVRRLIALSLLATGVGMGPGLALVEARAHAERGPGHGRRDHFETRGGQDHDDRCAVAIASAPANPSPPMPASVRIASLPSTTPAVAGFVPAASDGVALPPSRAPPSIG